MNIKYIRELSERNRHGIIIKLLSDNINTWSINDYKAVFEEICEIKIIIFFVNDILIPLYLKNDELKINIKSYKYYDFKGGICHYLHEVKYYMNKLLSDRVGYFDKQKYYDTYLNALHSNQIFILKYLFSKEIINKIDFVKPYLQNMQYQIRSLKSNYLDFMTTPRILNTIQMRNQFCDCIGYNGSKIFLLHDMCLEDCIDFLLRFKKTKYYDILFDNETYKQIIEYIIKEFLYNVDTTTTENKEQLKILKNIFSYHYDDNNDIYS